MPCMRGSTLLLRSRPQGLSLRPKQRWYLGLPCRSPHRCRWPSPRSGGYGLWAAHMLHARGAAELLAHSNVPTPHASGSGACLLPAGTEPCQNLPPSPPCIPNRGLPRCAPQGMWRVVEALLAAGVTVQPGNLAPWRPQGPYALHTDNLPTADFPRSHRRVWWVGRRRRGGPHWWHVHGAKV